MPLTRVDFVTASAVLLGLQTGVAALGFTGVGWRPLATLFTPPCIFTHFAAN